MKDSSFYEKKFGEAMTKGDYNKAEGLLSKTLEAMKEAFKVQTDFGKSIKENMKAHEENIKAIKELLRATKGEKVDL